VVKLISRAITHKSDVGGVVLDILSPLAAREAAEAIVARLRAHDPTAVVDGFSVQPMIERRNAWELLLGATRDPIFGPVVLFGSGGVSVEVVAETAVALPPLDTVLAGDLIDEARVGKLLAGFRNEPPADRAAICKALTALSQLIVDSHACFRWISTRWSPAPRSWPQSRPRDPPISKRVAKADHAR
jgi:acetyltransferase